MLELLLVLINCIIFDIQMLKIKMLIILYIYMPNNHIYVVFNKIKSLIKRRTSFLQYMQLSKRIIMLKSNMDEFVSFNLHCNIYIIFSFKS